MKRLHRGLLALAGCTALALPIVLAASGTVAQAVDPAHLTGVQRRLLSGFASFEFGAGSGVAASDLAAPSLRNYTPRADEDCGSTIASNVLVNQNCLNLTDADLQGRGQAQNETSIAADPGNPSHIVASYNDYRRGDGTCGTSYSLDHGGTWNDSTVPDVFTRGSVSDVVDFGADREYWEAGGDTSVAWDSKGNVYLSCQLFNRGLPTSSQPDVSSALVVFRSTQNDGASWNFPGRYVRASNDTAGTGTAPFLDKQLMTVDNNPRSCSSDHSSGACTRFQDRVYVTWTEFAADGSAFIYETFSNDYGEHFSSPRLVSRNNPTLCTDDFGVGTVATTGESSACNANQDSQPFVGPDGSLYVVWGNYNNTLTGTDNRHQMLLSKSTDGGDTFSTPVKVGDFYDLPDCLTYQGKDPGRACVPEKDATSNSIFRADNYPSGAVDPTNPQQVVVSYGSYINPHSKEANGCVPTGVNPDTAQNLYTGVKAPGSCNNDILYSVSGDGGGTFTGTSTDPRSMPTVNQASGQATTDQFWPWLSFTKAGWLAVSYYDRQYGDDEVTGFSDISLSGSVDLTRFAAVRVTSSSMPYPTEFDGTFYGDYSGLSAVDFPFPAWSDTRNPDVFLCPDTGTSTTPPRTCTAETASDILANDQDVVTAGLAVPSRWP
jgi:hypothetical protein